MGDSVGALAALLLLMGVVVVAPIRGPLPPLYPGDLPFLLLALSMGIFEFVIIHAYRAEARWAMTCARYILRWIRFRRLGLALAITWTLGASSDS